ncbi:ROK family protein [Streptomyces sp. VRA16 Mangrove soil]|uniref:ROK family protein n=1 Tax=Streptomyces sp. VRA16 Mangrove soil TaxID=2817434 RepID=UPI001A9E7559|nr:ROK family protein [Streptomyces sp. VRA16 Mangrove soil]MBO1332306.1 ROK family protein [Streptomyces sp. VRA16 Mangrove soil]
MNPAHGTDRRDPAPSDPSAPRTAPYGTAPGVGSGTLPRGTALLGVDIGGTKAAAVLFGPDHTALARLTAPTPAVDGPDAVLGGALRLAGQLLAQARERDLTVPCLGIGTAGIVAPDGRRILAATDALPGWAGTPLADIAERRLGLPVRALGDVQAFLVGESASGAAAGAATAVAVMAGTGIGGAVAVGGHTLLGANGAAGSLGHIPVAAALGRRCPCGARGHVEAVAGGPAMAARFGASDLRTVAAAAHEGHEAARAVLAAGGAALGEALAGVVATLDPDVVVVAGGVLDSGPWYLDALRAELAARTLPALRRIPVRAATLGADAVALGAAVHAGRCAAAPGPV